MRRQSGCLKSPELQYSWSPILEITIDNKDEKVRCMIIKDYMKHMIYHKALEARQDCN